MAVRRAAEKAEKAARVRAMRQEAEAELDEIPDVRLSSNKPPGSRNTWVIAPRGLLAVRSSRSEAPTRRVYALTG